MLFQIEHLNPRHSPAKNQKYNATPPKSGIVFDNQHPETTASKPSFGILPHNVQKLRDTRLLCLVCPVEGLYRVSLHLVRIFGTRGIHSSRFGHHSCFNNFFCSRTTVTHSPCLSSQSRLVLDLSRTFSLVVPPAGGRPSDLGASCL